MSLFLIVAIPVCITIFVTGVGLLLASRHNRRLDTDHPFCKRCGFDLYTRYPDLTACPECGADLTRPNPVRWGRNPWAPAVQRLGLILIALGLFLSIAMLATQYRNGRLIPYAPDFVLSWEVRNDTKRADQAFTQLHRRTRLGEISQRTVDRLVQEGLARQADLNRPWDADWGQLIQIARRQGQVSDVDFDLYLQQAIDSGVHFVVKHVDAQSIAFDFSLGPLRIGADRFVTPPQPNSARLIFQAEPVEMRLGSWTQADNGRSSVSSPNATAGGGGVYYFPKPPDLSATPVYTVDVRVMWVTDIMNPGQELLSKRIGFSDPNYQPTPP